MRKQMRSKGMSDYGLALKKLREHFSLTQRELGARVGISNHAISKWENGVNEPDLATLQSICAVYGVSMEAFFRIAAGESVESVLTPKEMPVEEKTTGAGTRPSRKLPLILSLASIFLCVLIITVVSLTGITPDGDSTQSSSQTSSSVIMESNVETESQPSEPPSPSVHHLSYYVDGQLKGSADVFNGVLSSPYIPEKTGYVFLGWFTKQTGGEPFDFDHVTSSASIHAQFRPIQYTIVFQTEYGQETQTMCVDYAESWNFPDAIFQRNEYIQSGWETDDGKAFALRSKGENLTVTDGATVFVTAIWTWSNPDSVCVKFIADEGSTGYMPDQTKHLDSPFTLPTCSYQKVGYIFDTWSYNGTYYEAGTQITLTAADAASGECKFYAVWKGISWTINFWIRYNGTIYEVSQGYTYGDAFAYLADENIFSYHLYTFDNISGWIIEGKRYAVSQSIVNFTTIHNKEFWAEAITFTDYKIHFSGGAGANGEMKSIQARSDQPPSLPECTFTCYGKMFVGWEYDGVIYQPGELFPCQANETNYTLTATWQGIPHSITFTSAKHPGKSFTLDVIYLDEITKEELMRLCEENGMSFSGLTLWGVRSNGVIFDFVKQDYYIYAYSNPPEPGENVVVELWWEYPFIW